MQGLEQHRKEVLETLAYERQQRELTQQQLGEREADLLTYKGAIQEVESQVRELGEEVGRREQEGRELRMRLVEKEGLLYQLTKKGSKENLDSNLASK